ncbi:hypothetical protein FPOAC1_009293 [Fusarium poae]|uniref:hypothetical protein n=1 Tax=Fusarium poae TaxID=36050 RepID=UPI001CE7F17C|nr:hypothetical protein FPOAC1_009293 [Fusarium poae]KAG8669893.1 hypothetical protein FPOAC1_009293 [Fusarium poae]
MAFLDGTPIIVPNLAVTAEPMPGVDSSSLLDTSANATTSNGVSTGATSSKEPTDISEASATTTTGTTAIETPVTSSKGLSDGAIAGVTI